ncbi:glycoside hydrolase family 47 protein [Tilletiaria anomala UBC 951]|uniref:alpha-1,2-Mannosidase n=1 Tax=Tilletiaria anomala (strain ATCC 24038 / CBS 436.72 / UBC 951) TaxID=1037660 RepID=A0A066VYN6_TILAU|nr:glycoside hydrolase family 47 protein [Tilletiaria anomala UBC 951]KDN43914.1 glycoside hydrolase family 47 protein [Tilletiaria anomala UBC 951]
MQPMTFTSLYTLLSLALLALAGAQLAEAATTPRVQASNLTQTAQSKQRAAAIKVSFQSSFAAYKQYAFPADALLPLSKGKQNNLGGWGATAIDAITTAILMNDTDIANSMISYAQTVNYGSTSQSTISLFETNIRHLGGLLSAYELTGKKNRKLVQQAEVVGKHLLKGWVGSNAIPFNSLRNWNTYGKPDANGGRAIIAEAGTLLLEFSKLSKYTGNDTYLSYARRSMAAIVKSPSVFPGLYGQGINPVTALPMDDYVTWGGGSDSFFEYLIKYAYLAGNSSSIFADAWIHSIQSSIKHLLVVPQGHPELLFLSDYAKSYGGDIPRWSHLGCFAPGNWILGGKILGVPGFVDYGYRLASSCAHTYSASATGIGPEAFVYKENDGSTNGVTISNEAQYNRAGFDYDSPAYVLRPEVMESVFYAWRASGDPAWQEIAWNAFQSISKYCKTDTALAAIQQVNNTATGQYDDSESFLYAELYKYLYLIFADPNVAHLDKYVFNTEGHPFELDRPGAFQARHSTVVPSPQPAIQKQPTRTHTASMVPMPVFSNMPQAASAFVGAVQSTVARALASGSASGASAKKAANAVRRHFQKSAHAFSHQHQHQHQFRYPQAAHA